MSEIEIVLHWFKGFHELSVTKNLTWNTFQLWVPRELPRAGLALWHPFYIARLVANKTKFRFILI